ncbi:MAG: hypothetical protein J0L62_07010 [Bacteroidetes bacterium]|nr:hypothetical protein [Bacteroidota bacterium]
MFIVLSGCKNPKIKPILQTGKVQINLKTTVGSKGRAGSFAKSFVFITIRNTTGEKVLSNFKVQLLREGTWFASIPVSLPAGSYLIDPVIFWDEAESLLLEFSAPTRFIISQNQLKTIKSERGSVVRASLADSLKIILDENLDLASFRLSVKAVNHQMDSLFFVDGTILKSIDGTPVSLTYLTRETQKIRIAQNYKPKTVSFTIKSPDFRDTTLVYNIPENEIIRTRSAEIQLEPISPIKKQLVAWYPFNGNAKDLSGNQFHGKEKQVIYVKDRFGRDENAVKCNKDSQILIGDVFNDLSIPFTISFWLKTNYYDPDINAKKLTIRIFDSDFNLLPIVFSGITVQLVNGFISTSIGNGAGFGYQYRKNFTSSKFVADGKWHLITSVVKSPKDMSIFINDQSGYCRYISERYNGKATRLEHSTYPAVIGALGEGILDDFRIYNFALSREKIDSLYHEGGWK